MIMADVFKILFLVLGFLVTLVCYWLMFQALYGEAVERARGQYERHGRKTLFAGLGVTVPVFLLGAAMASAPNGLIKLIGVGLLLALALVALFGSAGLAQRVGLGLASANDVQWPWRRVLKGGTVLAITFVLPLVGWFVILPLTLISGVGAAALAYRERPKATTAPAVTAGVETHA